MTDTTSEYHPLTEDEWQALGDADASGAQWKSLEEQPGKYQAAFRRIENEVKRIDTLEREKEREEFIASLFFAIAAAGVMIFAPIVQPTNWGYWFFGGAGAFVLVLATFPWFWMVFFLVTAVTLTVVALSYIVHFMIFQAVLAVFGAAAAFTILVAIYNWRSERRRA